MDTSRALTNSWESCIAFEAELTHHDRKFSALVYCNVINKFVIFFPIGIDFFLFSEQRKSHVCFPWSMAMETKQSLCKVSTHSHARPPSCFLVLPSSNEGPQGMQKYELDLSGLATSFLISLETLSSPEYQLFWVDLLWKKKLVLFSKKKNKTK